MFLSKIIEKLNPSGEALLPEEREYLDRIERISRLVPSITLQLADLQTKVDRMDKVMLELLCAREAQTALINGQSNAIALNTDKTNRLMMAMELHLQGDAKALDSKDEAIASLENRLAKLEKPPRKTTPRRATAKTTAKAR